MTARAALQNRVFEARSFRYLPDADGPSVVERLARDVWSTPAEFEEKGGGDCEDYAIWAIIRSTDATKAGDFFLVAGRVKMQGQWLGHAWVELVEDGERLWCDPCWGYLPHAPSYFGFPASRAPLRRWHFDRAGGIFADEEMYTWSAA